MNNGFLLLSSALLVIVAGLAGLAAGKAYSSAWRLYDGLKAPFGGELTGYMIAVGVMSPRRLVELRRNVRRFRMFVVLSGCSATAAVVHLIIWLSG